jgi:hypothetical protein
VKNRIIADFVDKEIKVKKRGLNKRLLNDCKIPDTDFRVGGFVL